MNSLGDNMGSEGLNHDERTYLIEAIYRIVGQVERKFDALRATDREAVSLAHRELSLRLEGFPQLYGTKTEMEAVASAVRRLENSALSREVYEQRHLALNDEVDQLQKDMLPRVVFDVFVEQYRLDQDRNLVDRRNVVESLATATNQVREQVIADSGELVTQTMYDQQQHLLAQQVDSVERWQYKLVGGLVFATFLAPLVTALVVYAFTTGL